MKQSLSPVAPISFMRDAFVPSEQAQLSIAASPMLYGLAVYTVCGAYWDNATKQYHVFRLNDHYKRLSESAKILDFASIETVISFAAFQAAISGLLNNNKLQQDVLIRATLFIDELAAGTRTYGLKTSFCAYIYPMGEILPRSGAQLCVSSWKRTEDNAIPSRAKINGSYINATLMKNEALRNGYDDAIALDSNGHVAEGTVANIFLVRNGKLITPHGATDILEGITRNALITLAATLDMPCEERDVDRSELYVADEMFVCGSSARITPVIALDKRIIGDGSTGPVTKLMSKHYEAIVRGHDERFSTWITTL
jgi:branched-chain amino acid aminotransferase